MVLELLVVEVVVATDPELACVDEVLVVEAVEADGVELLEQAASPSASRTTTAARGRSTQCAVPPHRLLGNRGGCGHRTVPFVTACLRGIYQ